MKWTGTKLFMGTLIVVHLLMTFGHGMLLVDSQLIYLPSDFYKDYIDFYKVFVYYLFQGSTSHLLTSVLFIYFASRFVDVFFTNSETVLLFVLIPGVLGGATWAYFNNWFNEEVQNLVGAGFIVSTFIAYLIAAGIKHWGELNNYGKLLTVSFIVVVGLEMKGEQTKSMLYTQIIFTVYGILLCIFGRNKPAKSTNDEAFDKDVLDSGVF